MFAIAPTIINYFSQDEDAGGTPGTLSVWKRGPTVRVNNRDAPGPLVQVPDIHGNVAPALDADLDITDAAGRRREGHLSVTTIERLQMDDEATRETSWLIFHKGYFYMLEEQDGWDYAQGNVYRATRDRAESNV